MSKNWFQYKLSLRSFLDNLLLMKMDLLGMSKIQDNLQNPNRKLIGKMLFSVYAGIKKKFFFTNCYNHENLILCYITMRNWHV